MSKERWRGVSRTEGRELGKEAEKADQLRKSRIEALKDAARWGWIVVTVSALAAMNFSEERVIKDIGGTIFLTNLLGPGVLMAKDMVTDIIDKWHGKDIDSLEENVESVIE